MGKIISAGCDWLTVTTGDEVVMGQLGAVWWQVMVDALADAGIITDTRWLGYDGQMVNGQFYGERGDGRILKLTGKYANLFAQAALKTTAHCTRIDFQVTEQLECYDALYGENQRQVALSERATMEGRRWPKIKRRDEDGDGDTITTGARSSDKFGRLYDKERESGDDEYKRCWRWEVEYKGPHAVAYAQGLQNSDDVARYSRAAVYSQYKEWGFDLPFTGGSAFDVYSPVRVTGDIEKTIDWLTVQVAPSVRKLLEKGVSRETFVALFGL